MRADKMKISFFVPGNPVAQPRQKQRVAKIGGRMVAMNYLERDNPVNAYKYAISSEAQKAMAGADPTGEPCRLTLLMVFGRPKKLMAKKSPRGRIRKTSKPDGDNVEKAVKDAMCGIVYRDDALVTDATKQKVFNRLEGDPCGTYVTIETMPEVIDE